MLGLDPLKSFTPIASVSLLPHVMVVPASVPAKTVQEFVAYAKANPGKLNFGAGLGAPPHLLGVLFKNKAGIDVTYVPYKGAAPAVTDMLGGQTHFAIDGMLILMPHIKAGKLRALAVGRPQRWHELPDVPTMTESGFPNFTIDAWTGVVAPAGTPPQIIERLNGAVNAGLLEPGDGNRHGALQLDHQNRDAGGIRGLHRVGSAALGGDGEARGRQGRVTTGRGTHIRRLHDAVRNARWWSEFAGCPAAIPDSIQGRGIPAIPVGAGHVFRAIGGIAISRNLGLWQRVTVPAVTE